MILHTLFLKHLLILLCVKPNKDELRLQGVLSLEGSDSGKMQQWYFWMPKRAAGEMVNEEARKFLISEECRGFANEM